MGGESPADLYYPDPLDLKEKDWQFFFSKATGASVLGCGFV